MKYLVVFLLLYSTQCLAGNDSLNKNGYLLFKWNPSTLVAYSSIQLGAEFFYKPNWSLHTEAGLIIPYFEKAALSPEDNKGYRFKLHHRYHFGKYFIDPELHLGVHYKSNESLQHNL